ncbi:MAG: hypothetical protein KGJ58_01840 [Patescibacteria group bacterium]|nr:hypothetical protein [Patescibacteria group bacterium]MDE2218180.1 hypothetical protein [Patescibacteria group bacterium]
MIFVPYIDRYYDFGFGSFIFLAENKYGVIFFDLEKYVSTTISTFRKFQKLKNIDHLLEYKDFLSIWEKGNEYYKKYTPEKLKSIKEKELDAVAKLCFNLVPSILASTVFCEALDENLIYKFYKEIGGEDKNFKVFFDLSARSTFESFATKFDRAILSLKEDSDHYAGQWMLSDYYICPPIEESAIYFDKIIKDKGGFEKISAELDKISNDILSNKKKIYDFKNKLSKDLNKLLEYIQLCLYVRDIRKEPIQKIIALISNIVREIFKRKNIPQDDIVWGYYADFTDGTYKKNDYCDQIKLRKKGIAVYVNKNGYEFEYGRVKEIKDKAYKFMDEREDNEMFEIRGNTGCKGRVIAKVSIILDRSEFSRFIPGNILVTSMTRAEFVPLMKKSSAIVTDEGGITCHAAIISRELNKPCIVGTKNATRILKDGDLVEVDADNGVVRIIKKAK